MTTPEDRIVWEADREALYRRHGAAQNRTESDDGAETAPVGVGTAEGARAARFRDAMLKAEWPNGTKAGRYGVDVLLPAVMAVSDAEVSAAVSEAQAKVTKWRLLAHGETIRAETAEATVQRVEALADRLDARFLHEDADAIRRALATPPNCLCGTPLVRMDLSQGERLICQSCSAPEVF